MDWIKKNYEQFFLLLLALLLLAISLIVIFSGQGFKEIFAEVKGQAHQNNKIPAIKMGGLDEAKTDLQKAPEWNLHNGSLFKSREYVAKDGKLIDVNSLGEMLHPPVPNPWFKKHGLDVLNPNVLSDDPDKDGFTNLDEWKWNMDPQSADSHPPYYAKLLFEKLIEQPFRVVFKAYNGKPSKPDSMSFQLNAIDANIPTQFLKIGDKIPKTSFQLKKFTYKTTTDSNGVSHDISELTAENTKTHQEVVLVMEKLANYPDSFALFKYGWKGDEELKVKKGASFTLKPDQKIQYKLLDVNGQNAVIQLPTGEKVKIPLNKEPSPASS